MSVNSKILVTGASGLLAQTLLPCAAAEADVVGVARHAHAISELVLGVSCDITDRDAVFAVVDQHKPNAIIHCAACNPGGSDEQMFAVNNVGTKHVVEAANAFNVRLVSISSDTVLSGEHAPYSEDATSSPLQQNAYAVSKAQGEEHVRTIAPNAAIVRTSLIYGTERIDRGTQGFIDRLNAGDRLSLFNDVIRQPVHDKALSAGLCKLALEHQNESGVINLVGDESMSRYAFGIRMLDFWGVDYAGMVDSVSAADLPGVPMDLRVQMVRATELGIEMPGVTQVLDNSIR